jgi:hypothetical protein
MSADITGVIATVFRPPQLAKLTADLHAAGAAVVISEGMRTNAAWNEGLAQVQTRYAVVLNDDIEVSEGWVQALLAHHAAGYTHVAGSMWREVKAPKPGARDLGTPAHKGHLFSMDLRVDAPPVPKDLSIYFGDDWFYWHHRYKGRCCVALDVLLKTGFDFPDREHMSGYTCHHPDIETFLGEPLIEVARRDFVVAPKYFVFPQDNQVKDMRKFPQGNFYMAVGLKDA